jgi:hypothetical protein
MAAMCGYAASFNGNASSWDDTGEAVIYDYFPSYAKSFESEDISWDVAGATVSYCEYDWYVRLSGVVQRQRKLV